MSRQVVHRPLAVDGIRTLYVQAESVNGVINPNSVELYVQEGFVTYPHVVQPDAATRPGLIQFLKDGNLNEMLKGYRV